jgi:hypothetical protein
MWLSAFSFEKSISRSFKMILPAVSAFWGSSPRHAFPKGCFAGSRFPHQGQALTFFDGKGRLLNRLNAVIPVPVDNTEILDDQTHDSLPGELSRKRGSTTFSRLMARKVTIMISRDKQTMGGKSQCHQMSI